MRLLIVLGFCCLLSSGVFGVHTKLHSRICRLFEEAESHTVRLRKDRAALKKILDEISVVKRENFFQVLHICACSKYRGYSDLHAMCLRKFRTTPPYERYRCWYYFEEMFCVESTHEINNIAIMYHKTRIEAMIEFLTWSKGMYIRTPLGRSISKNRLISIYRRCMREFEENEEDYIRRHEDGNREEWTYACFTEEW